MKEMPYKIPDGYMENAKRRARTEIHALAASRQTAARVRIFKPAISAIVAIACIAVIGWVGYVEMRPKTNWELLVEQMADASDDLIFEQSCDFVEYTCDISQL